MLITILRRAASLVVALLILAGASLVVASPAAAAGESCGSINICMWNNSSLTGTPTYHWTAPLSNQCIPMNAPINDVARSVKITAGTSAAFYENAGCSGPLITTVTTLGGATNRLANCTDTYMPWNGFCNQPRASSFWYVA